MQATRPSDGPLWEGTPTSSNPKPDHDAARDDAGRDEAAGDEAAGDEAAGDEARRQQWQWHAARRTAAPPKGRPRLQRRVEECGNPARAT